MLFPSLLLAASAAASSLPEAALERGHRLYFAEGPAKAFDAYVQAVKLSSTGLQGWLNGAVALEELGRRQDAAKWYARAAALSADPAVWTALAWSRWRAGEAAGAGEAFGKALGLQSDEPYALLGRARLALDQNRPADAAEDLGRALEAAPLLHAALYYRGKAHELLDEPDKAAEDYRQAIAADSYMTEAREALGRLHLKRRAYNDAWKVFNRILDSEPKNRKFAALLDKIQPLLTRRAAELRPSGLYLPIPYLAPSPINPVVPELRVGLGTNPLGKPRARLTAAFRATSPFDVVDVAGGKRLLSGPADAIWRLEVRSVKRRRSVALIDAAGKTVALSKAGFLVKPRQTADGIIALDPGSGGAAGKLLRGSLEGALFKGSLRLVNVLDLENYTHGVVSAEMPIKSPLEALKAQAMLARTHALFIKKYSRRHRKEGYDVCDEQHCQVYAGARSESARSRDVVEATRGRIVSYRGKIAHVIYSSNCGGHTQSGRDLVGWGDVPYWQGMRDTPSPEPAPASPWALRRFLYGFPKSFCQPSADVHASHFRWTRVVNWADLDEKLGRRLKVGKLKAVRALRRSPSGNVNLLLVEGSKRSKKVSSEIEIRGLLGLGSLRSTQFVIDHEYDSQGKPTALVVRGGGWGHGVGMCQSGAMGRAQAGQTYDQIIRAYFKGVDLGQLAY